MMGTWKKIQYIIAHRKISHAPTLPGKKHTTIEMFTGKRTQITHPKKKKLSQFVSSPKLFRPRL